MNQNHDWTANQINGVNLSELLTLNYLGLPICSAGQTMKCFKAFLISEDGPSAVEYAVMLARIIVVCISTVTTIGTKANAKLQ